MGKIGGRIGGRSSGSREISPRAKMQKRVLVGRLARPSNYRGWFHGTGPLLKLQRLRRGEGRKAESKKKRKRKGNRGEKKRNVEGEKWR